MPPLILNRDNPQIRKDPNDIIPPDARVDLSLDEERLSDYILELFRNDIRDKEDYGWISRREYDISSYYGLKDKALSEWPWKNSCNFPVPIIPTILDTAHANIKASMWSNIETPVRVKGVGVEDQRKANILEGLLNWQVVNETNIQKTSDLTTFLTFLHGTGIEKVTRNVDSSINIANIEIENFFLPINAKGLQREHTDHVFQIVPLSPIELQYRKSLGVYRDIDKIAPGIGIHKSNSERLTYVRDAALGTDMQTKSKRDIYYLMEAYLTYFDKNSLRPRELIVWMSPNGGTIHRVMENPDDNIRPFADYHVYPQPNRFFSLSLAEKLKNIQEEATYANKQMTDAMDRSNSPAGFVDSTAAFDQNISQRVPGGIYEKGPGTTIEWEPQPPVERGWSQKLTDLWIQAEKLTGIFDITQGASSNSDRTLGETRIRVSRADIRFRTIFDRFENGWSKTIGLIYHYDNKYMPRDKKIKIIGYEDYQSIDELFPNDNNSNFGLNFQGKFDFRLGGKAITDIERQREDTLLFYDRMIGNPLVQNPANLWRITDQMAKVLGIENFDQIITRPREVNIYSPEEFIQRVISGQKNLQIRPGIDTTSYIFELNLFTKTETYATLNQELKNTILTALRRATIMQQAERLAQIDTTILQQQVNNDNQGISNV